LLIQVLSQAAVALNRVIANSVRNCVIITKKKKKKRKLGFVVDAHNIIGVKFTGKGFRFLFQTEESYPM
jgi:hypothetical protein